MITPCESLQRGERDERATPDTSCNEFLSGDQIFDGSDADAQGGRAIPFRKQQFVTRHLV
jgi:hypothetical protein